MNKLNKKIEYALMALGYIQSQGSHRPVSAAQICNALFLPFDGMAKTMQQLQKHNILKSEKGVTGGYRLNVDLQSISFNDLIKSVLGDLQIVNCLSNQVYCKLTPHCSIKAPMGLLNKKLKKLYSSISLQELLEAEPETQQDTSLSEDNEAFYG